MPSDNNKDDQPLAYEDDPRTSCQYGAKCYQKNPQHHSKYKHPPKRETIDEKTETLTTGVKRKNPIKDHKNERSKSPQNKLQKTFEPEKKLHNLSPSPERTGIVINKNENDNKHSNEKISNKEILTKHNSVNSVEYNATESISVSDMTAQNIIMDLFLVKMPKDFFQFYEFCKNISKDNPLLACKSVRLKLVGPYDVLDGKITSIDGDKEKYLTHWRYYYDVPEFQTIMKCDDKEGLHFGYWRDDTMEKPVFIAKNRANVNGIFEPVAENIFGAVDAYLQNKTKSANPFEKTSIIRLHSQLKNFAKKHNITLEKNSVNMRARERRVVARTFHKVGIVVPYDKKTQLGYRELAATDSKYD
ncbi:histone PARylation factor 1-like [Pogonomyrmex barbatus]|uniref:Histone PARylation factor 1-like n=1 Tax=Pogonomyrmex barbatus TaxID=144034 RepID=A0A6I9WD94_9HYME|nr:histone PARylation factor 1-like [Pogonomyrmex barbatus]